MVSSHFPFFCWGNEQCYCIDLNPVRVSGPVALDLAKYEGFFSLIINRKSRNHLTSTTLKISIIPHTQTPKTTGQA